MYNPYDWEKYPVRKRTRLKGYDYSLPNVYFVTVCTHDRKCLFGKAGDCNRYGKMAEDGILRIPDHFPQVQILKYVVMPNHVHILLRISGGDRKLDRIIGNWKAYVTREIHRFQPEMKIWQTSFHDHIIRNEQAFQKIWLYIEGDPMNWDKDCFFTET